MIVVVAEKPSVGRDIARVLKCRANGDGFVKNDAYTVTWAVGHLVSLCEPDEVDEKYKKWRMADLPILPQVIPTKVLPKTKKQYGVIKALINDKETEKVICATDAGREGELIFRLIYHQSKCKKPVERLWINSMTDEAIRDGFAALKPSQAYDGLYRSAECRSQADWLVGMNASRAFTLRYDALLSIGRVQTPTLAILVKRYHEIANFKPEAYFTVNADFGDYTGQWFDPNAKDDKTANRIPDKQTADAIAARVKGKPARVTDVSREDKRELPPQLYDLSSLQRDANRLLGFTAQKTLKLAQALYEQYKCLTYPRTDSKCLPNDMYDRTRQTLAGLPEPYQPLLKGMTRSEQGKLPFFKRVFDNSKVTDHHAIIPTTKKVNLDALPKDERALFDLVARRLIAAFYPAYEYQAIRVVTMAQDDAFRSSGRAVKELGWKRVYDEKSDEPLLPNLCVGDTRVLQKATVKNETTKPPAPHTDASLLAAMERAGRELEDEELRQSMKGSGLGTPATRAAIIERLIAVGYAQRKGRAISATDKGVQLIAIAPDEIASPEMTGKWELALEKIASGEQDEARFMSGIRNLTTYLVQFAQEKAADGDFPKEERRGGKKGARASGAQVVKDAVCPLCGKPVQENTKAFGCSGWRDGCHFTLWKDGLSRAGGPALSGKLVALLLKNGEVRGSTGTIAIKNGELTFTKEGDSSPCVRVSVVYEKKA